MHQSKLIHLFLKKPLLMKKFASITKRGSYYLKHRSRKIDQKLIKDISSFIAEIKASGYIYEAKVLKTYLINLENKSISEFLDYYK